MGSGAVYRLEGDLYGSTAEQLPRFPQARWRKQCARWERRLSLPDQGTLSLPHHNRATPGIHLHHSLQDLGSGPPDGIGGNAKIGAPGNSQS